MNLCLVEKGILITHLLVVAVFLAGSAPPPPLPPSFLDLLLLRTGIDAATDGGVLLAAAVKTIVFFPLEVGSGFGARRDGDSHSHLLESSHDHRFADVVPVSVLVILRLIAPKKWVWNTCSLPPPCSSWGATDGGNHPFPPPRLLWMNASPFLGGEGGRRLPLSVFKGRGGDGGGGHGERSSLRLCVVLL